MSFSHKKIQKSDKPAKMEVEKMGNLSRGSGPICTLMLWTSDYPGIVDVFGICM
jgi:hypothetical protein